MNLCQSILKRGQISGDDAYGLAQWLNEHQEACDHWPGVMLIKRLQQMWADGCVNKGELSSLHRLLLRVTYDWRLLHGDREVEEHTFPDFEVPMSGFWSNNDVEAVGPFCDYVASLFPDEANLEWCVEPKIDGAFVNARYVRGTLISMATKNQFVTRHVVAIKGIPPRISVAPDLLEVRGDVCVNREDFNRVNTGRQRDGKRPYVSGLKMVVGALRTEDPSKIAPLGLQFIASELGECGAYPVPTQIGVLRWFAELGFVSVEGRACSKQAIVSTIRLVRDQALDFDARAVVVKANLILIQRALGSDATSRRWAMTFPM